VLLQGGAQSEILCQKGSAFESRTYPPHFLLPHARKDLKLVERSAAREKRPVRKVREARKLHEEALALGHDKEDFWAVREAALARAGDGHRGAPAATAAVTPPDGSSEGDSSGSGEPSPGPDGDR
jgi:hypothetical protein